MRWETERYAFQLKVPPFVRQGIFLRVQHENGLLGIGEIAPLPSWSRENLEEAEAQLKDVMPHIASGKPIDENRLFPSVSFGIDAALSSSNESFSLPLSGLLQGNRKEILQAAQDLMERGYQSAKVKISALSLEDATQIVAELKSLFSLRIDLNRSWSLEQAERFFDAFPKESFAYIEEPLQNPLELTQFTHPFALDETLRDHPLEPFAPSPNLKALIIKPTLMGGYERLAPLKKWGIPLIFSSCYESGVGLSHIARLAWRLGSKGPLGIDTYRYIAQDLLKQPLCVREGQLWIDGHFQETLLQS